MHETVYLFPDTFCIIYCVKKPQIISKNNLKSMPVQVGLTFQAVLSL